MRLLNTTREAVHVPLKGEAKDGDVPMDSIASGETKELNVDPNNMTVQGLLFAGALERVDAGKAKSKE
jgi:hypothetical protein